MAYPLLLCVNPDSNADVSLDPKVDTTEFNDGYKQVTTKGAFNQPRTISLKWTNCRYDNAQYLIGFIEALRGAQYFLYSMPEEVQRLYQCTKFSYKWKHGRVADLSATFTEVYG